MISAAAAWSKGCGGEAAALAAKKNACAPMRESSSEIATALLLSSLRVSDVAVLAGAAAESPVGEESLP